MERVVRERAPDVWDDLLQSLWRLLIPTWMRPSTDAAILVRMAAALKAESEAALGGSAIVSAAVTAPWMAAWDGQIPSKSTINEVLVKVGIEPVSWEIGHPMYLGETNSLLAANQRQLCLDRWCASDFGWDFKEKGAVIFLIRYANVEVGICCAIYGYLYRTASRIDLSTHLFKLSVASISTRGTTT